MKKLLSIALLGAFMGISFPLSASGNALSTESCALIEQAEIDQRLVEQILRALEQEYGYDYNCLCDQYAEGTLVIDKVIDGYQVTFADSAAEDGIGIIILDNW